MKILLIILTLLFSGCTTIKPAIAEYYLTAKDIKVKNDALGCRDKSLKIANVFSSSSLVSSKMEYMQADNKVYSYSQSQWQESPNSMVESILLKTMRESELFSSVHPSKSRIKSSLILETNIEEFMQFFSKDLKTSHVKVTINFSLIDTKTNQVVAHKSFSSQVDARTSDAKGGVDAFREALSEILTKNLEYLSGVCR
ncbi:MAG: ABC-type transport auxiliary lipoprotein family protein [Sulfurimonas sp.]|uniref:ABC-type transport auxiliary lipoprotein family protein n=1 Tax=Sulfurimonas sp. TaxID=2022749 RepID=UPI003D0E8746